VRLFSASVTGINPGEVLLKLHRCQCSFIRGEIIIIHIEITRDVVKKASNEWVRTELLSFRKRSQRVYRRHIMSGSSPLMSPYNIAYIRVSCFLGFFFNYKHVKMVCSIHDGVTKSNGK
jgi:hypothetical protein